MSSCYVYTQYTHIYIYIYIYVCIAEFSLLRRDIVPTSTCVYGKHLGTPARACTVDGSRSGSGSGADLLGFRFFRWHGNTPTRSSKFPLAKCDSNILFELSGSKNVCCRWPGAEALPRVHRVASAAAPGCAHMTLGRMIYMRKLLGWLRLGWLNIH